MRRFVLVFVIVASFLALPSAARAEASDRVEAFGGAIDAGSPALAPGQRAVGMARASSGYWIATGNGGVQSFGGARFFGSAADRPLAHPVVGIARRPRGDGYWLAAADGGVFAFGAARFLGSLGGTTLAAPVVGIAAAPDGAGYWLAAADGGVFAFGSARYAGGMAGQPLAAPIVGIAAASGRGYWLAAADGGVFAFGAPYLGSAGHLALRSPITSVATTPSRDGYWLAARNGGVFTFGGADFHGAAAGGEPVSALASSVSGGYWVLRSPTASYPPLPPGSGSGRRIVYSNPMQRLWLVEADGAVARSYLVSGRRHVPAAGTYQVFSKSRHARADHDGITMDDMVRFAHGRDLAIGFHGIPRDRYGRPLQTDSDLGGFRSAGCVRQSTPDAAFLYDWAPLGTTVVVLW